MGTTRCLVESGAEELFEFVYKKALNQHDDTAFVAQTRCFASTPPSSMPNSRELA
jgi:hypothetical protein